MVAEQLFEADIATRRTPARDPAWHLDLHDTTSPDTCLQQAFKIVIALKRLPKLPVPTAIMKRQEAEDFMHSMQVIPGPRGGKSIRRYYLPDGSVLANALFTHDVVGSEITFTRTGEKDFIRADVPSTSVRGVAAITIVAEARDVLHVIHRNGAVPPEKAESMKQYPLSLPDGFGLLHPEWLKYQDRWFWLSMHHVARLITGEITEA